MLKMCDFEICRICLRTKSKFYNFGDYNLKKYYEELTNKSINNKDGLPQYFCYECAALLCKFFRFREKSDDGEKVLMDMLQNGLLTYAEICKLNAKHISRSKYMMLDILVSSKRVKTFHYHHAEDLMNIPSKAEIINEEFAESSDDDNFACNNQESDPIDDCSLNTIKMEQEKNDVAIDDTDNNIKTDKTESKQIAKFNNEEKKIETVSMLQNPSLVKPKRNQRVLEKRKIQVSKRCTQQKNNTKHIEKIYDSNDDSIELSKLKSEKSTLVISSETKKTYKPIRPKSDVRRFTFLNSENWKRSNWSDEDALEEFQKKALDKKYLKAPNKCELCFKWFSQKSILDRHMPQRHNESAGPFVCRFCKVRFKSKGLLCKHIRQHYNKFECLRCGLVCCVIDTAIMHEEYHSGVTRKCPHCDKEFQHLTSFYSHLRTHRSKHVCPLCGDSFVSELGLNQHRNVKHRVETTNNVVDVEEIVYCDVCKINFESKIAYQNHLANSALHTEENKNLDEYSVAEMMKTVEKTQGKEDTDTPAKSLVNRKSMVEKDLCAVRKRGRGREIRPHVKRPTTCQYCNMSFVSSNACLQHHLEEHRGKSFYSERGICEICGASLSVRSMFAHMNAHTNKIAFTCDTCGKSFTTSSMLRIHQVTHTGERKHACTLCDKRYAQSAGLALHYKTIHLKQPYPKRNRRKDRKGEE